MNVHERAMRAAALRALEIRTPVNNPDHKLLDGMLNEMFQELGLAGFKQRDGSIVTAYDAVMEHEGSTHEITPEERLAEFLQSHRVPVEKAVMIGAYWGARYGITPPSPSSTPTPLYKRPKTPANITSG